MNKISRVVFALCIIYNTTTALNIECVHKTIQNAIKKAASLEEYQTAWQEIAAIYLKSEKDLIPLIEYTIHEAQEQKEQCEQQLPHEACLCSPDKQLLVCGIGKLVVGAYLALGIIALPLYSRNYINTHTFINACFPMPKGIEKILHWFITRYRWASITMTKVENIRFYSQCAQWIASLPLAPYLLYKGVQKIDAGLSYTDILKAKITTLELIITSMQELALTYTHQEN